MKKVTAGHIAGILLLFHTLPVRAADAPVTLIPAWVSCSGSEIDVPVIVTGFNSIGAVSLTLEFDAAVINFQSFTNNSGFPGLTAFNPNPGIITAAGFSVGSGITLPDNTVLLTLHFAGLTGNSFFEWYDNGISCEYTGPSPTYEVLNDLPQEQFYINGMVIPGMSPEILTQPVSPDPVPEGFGSAIFAVVASGTDLAYQWQEFTGSWNDVIESTTYGGCQTPELTITNPPLSMNGYMYRCLINGACEPPAVTDGSAMLSVIPFTGFDNTDIVNNTDEIGLICSPNPFKEKSYIQLYLPFAGNLDIRMIDHCGLNVLQMEIKNIEAGNHCYPIEHASLSPGIYFLLVRIASEGKSVLAQKKIICFK